MPKAERIADILAGRIPVGATTTISGWVRTRRDSKAGLSFVAVHDGSSFDPLQVVAPAALANYEDEVLHLTAGCAVTITGVLQASQGKGQAVEMAAETVTVVGWVDDPDTYPISPKRHSFEYLREVAHLRVRTNSFGAMSRVRHTLAMAIHRYFDQNGFSWIHTPIITASDAEGAGELFRVSTLDLANLPRTADGAIDYAQDFFGKPAYLTVSGQLNVETYCLGLQQGLHLRPDVPGRELQHQPPPRRVLDGRTGDRVRRHPRQRRSRRSAPEVQLHGAPRRAAPTTWPSSPSGSTLRRSRASNRW